MRKYVHLLWENAYVGLLIVLLCACLGSIRGAWKEKREPYIGVTQEDMANMENAGESAPDMVGIIALAAEQSRWYNLSYAYHYAWRGVVCYCILMAVYRPLYHCRFFKTLRSLIKEDGGKGISADFGR